MTVLTDKPEVGRTDAALLVENSPRSTLLLLLRVGIKPKIIIGID